MVEHWHISGRCRLTLSSSQFFFDQSKFLIYCFFYRREDHLKEQEELEAKLRKDHETSLNHMRKKLEKELEDAKLEMLEDKEDRMRKIREEVEGDEEAEEEKLIKEKEKNIK